jgi:hypothetical protein
MLLVLLPRIGQDLLTNHSERRPNMHALPHLVAGVACQPSKCKGSVLIHTTTREENVIKCYTSPVDEASILLLWIRVKLADGRMARILWRQSARSCAMSRPSTELMHRTARCLYVAVCVPCLLEFNIHAHACHFALFTGKEQS